MIVIMKPGATNQQIETVVKRIKESGLDFQLNTGSEQVVIGLLGDT
ncbi:MAG: 3-deoxy-7-phosphoheptulonate synthase, partial [Enterococcus aquimarinus]